MFYNEALAGRSEVPLPEEMATPGFRGSVPGGIAIAAIGLVLLAHTLGGMSLEWLEEWWPAVLIAFGAYLVYKGREDQAAARRLEYDDS